jgi:hypothetical protein
VDEVDQQEHHTAQLYSALLEGQDEMGDRLKPVEEHDSGDGTFENDWHDYIAKYNIEDLLTIQGWFELKSAQQ